jgi:hypothetical protein
MRLILVGFVAGTLFAMTLLGGVYAWDRDGGFMSQTQRDMILQQQQMLQQQQQIERLNPQNRHDRPC